MPYISHSVLMYVNIVEFKCGIQLVVIVPIVNCQTLNNCCVMIIQIFFFFFYDVHVSECMCVRCWNLGVI